MGSKLRKPSVCVTREEMDFFFVVRDTDYGLGLLVRRKVMGKGGWGVPCLLVETGGGARQ